MASPCPRPITLFRIETPSLAARKATGGWHAAVMATCRNTLDFVLGQAVLVRPRASGDTAA